MRSSAQGRPLCAVLLAAVALGSDRLPVADSIYFNGRIVTLWDERPLAEALAIAGNRFIRIGSTTEVLQTAGPQTTKIDLRGRSVLPGLIDSHTHPIDAVLSELDGPLPPFNSIPAIQAFVRNRARTTPPDRPILVPKVFASRLAEHRYPTRDELDAAARDRPVLVDNGYASVLNTALLTRLRIDRTTPDPVGGRIVHDDRGEPTGLILGAHQLLAPWRDPGSLPESELVRRLKRLHEVYNRVGITSTIDRGQQASGLRAYQALHRGGGPTVRTTVTYRISGGGSKEEMGRRIEAIPLTTGWGDEWLRVGPLKVVVDGGILTGTAYLREPYGDRTAIYGYTDRAYRGELSVTRENLVEFARVAAELGWQATAHVTGGGALDLLLDAYETADREHPIGVRRFTATHGNFPDPRAIARARQLGVVFDVQPAWLYLDGAVVEGVLGPERIRHFLPLRSLVDAGVLVAGGSDHMIRAHPRESTNPYHPFLGMWIAVTRQTVDGRVIVPEERLDRLQALRLWTINGALLTFDEDRKGSIQPGKLADFIVISEDFLACPVDAIKNIEVLVTVVDGRVVHGRPANLR